jgi:hypothetical protein
MPDTTIPLIPCNGGGLGSQATIAQHLDMGLGANQGRAAVRGSSGWIAGHCVRINKMAIAGVVATTGGAIGNWVPAEALPAIITRVVFYVVTGSTGVANISIGVGATTTTSATNLITATSVHTSGVIIDSLTSQVAAVGALSLLMTGTQAITLTGSADTTGLVGILMIHFLLPNS